MTAPPVFDLVRTELLPGTSLIEASAGTGKTFTIAGLFLRLLLERGLSVRDILVVTYTVAATEELRGRVRQTLADALRAFESGASEVPFIQALVEKFSDAKRDKISLLDQALRGFDEAPIHTIHGFCQRTLKDRAFESGSLFDTELVTDQTPLLRQVVEDFWRRQVLMSGKIPVAFAAKNLSTPDALLPPIQSCLPHHGLEVLPSLEALALARPAIARPSQGASISTPLQRGDNVAASEFNRFSGFPARVETAEAVPSSFARDFTPLKRGASGKREDLKRPEGKTPAANLETLAASLTTAFASARQVWQADEQSIRAGFGSQAKWANKPYNRDDEMAERFRRVAACLTEADLSADALAALEQFTPRAIARGTSKRGKTAAPASPFFTACDELTAAAERFTLGLRLHALRFVEEELPRRKAALKVQSFDDLLRRFDAALAGPGGDALAAALRAQYPAALIDEFQDTDPVQYRILRRAFAAPENFLFLIGDPKQAIYGFRGADVFTYLAAARDADRCYTLRENWRSERGLVAATNAIFAANPAAFVLPEIAFHSVEAKGEADARPLRVAGRSEPPFQIWFAPRDGGDIAKNEAEAVLPQIVASEIARLLNRDTTIAGRRLLPEDVAVLVPENRQAQLMQQALGVAGIPSVLLATGSLFASREVTELKRVLAAIAEPANEPLLKSVLATDLLGRTADEIERLAADESAWQEILERFHRYLDLWIGRGFIQMFRVFLQQEQVRRRLLRFPDGERRLTNVLHLGEVLHQAGAELRLGVGGTLKWIIEQEAARDAVAEAHQLRLERDEKAVKLVTIHKSKGLEYPVVFCPFSWRGADIERNREEIVFLHDRRTRQLRRDLGSEKLAEHAAQARIERLAENIRLLYVALTRAKHRCCFVWGGFRGAATSAPAWLLHPPPGGDAAAVAALEARWPELDDARLRADLEKLRAESAGAIEVADLPASAAEKYEAPSSQDARLAVRPFTGTIQRDWRIASFSSLTAGRDDERPDYDSGVRAPAEAAPATGIFAFPRGTKAGTCLHKILERLDFPRWREPATRDVVAEELRSRGLPVAGFEDAVCEMISQVMMVPFPFTAASAISPQTSTGVPSPWPSPPMGERETSAQHRLDSDRAPVHPPRTSLLPLPLREGRGEGKPGLQPTAAFSLSEIPSERCLRELEFCFPLQRLSAPPLRALWAKHGLGGEAERLDFNPVTGMLKGFIDLICEWQGRFFIVDWKSNWLGRRVEDYGPEALREEIRRRQYSFQYRLYTVALDKYLRLRLPGYRYAEHFGGVFYVFLRGVDPARPDLGIFRDRPSEALVHELSEALSGGDERSGT